MDLTSINGAGRDFFLHQIAILVDFLAISSPSTGMLGAESTKEEHILIHPFVPQICLPFRSPLALLDGNSAIIIVSCCIYTSNNLSNSYVTICQEFSQLSTTSSK